MDDSASTLPSMMSNQPTAGKIAEHPSTSNSNFVLYAALILLTCSLIISIIVYWKLWKAEDEVRKAVKKLEDYNQKIEEKMPHQYLTLDVLQQELQIIVESPLKNAF